MKTKLIAVALFGVTVATVALYPAYHTLGAIAGVRPPVALTPPDTVAQQHRKIEVVFVLDTTGSMSGLIQAAKEKIWSIASTMASAQSAPEIRMGLVAYRDRGDDYVTRVVDLSGDLDSMYATLMDFKARGGGDGPESVNQALYDAVHKLSWSQDSDTYKVVFLVGDAAPHMDYQDDVKYPQTLADAKRRGIVVNAIQCGEDDSAMQDWRRIAGLGLGEYFQVAQSGGAVAVATPYDKRLAELSAELDRTRLYYGDEADKRRQAKKLAATEKLHEAASDASLARRAEFNASKSGTENFLGDKDLVADVASGRVDLSTIKPESLPAPMQAMAPAERAAVIEATAARRDALQSEVKALAEQRAAHIAKKVEEAGGAGDSLDDKIYRAVREQAGKVGLSYESDAPKY